MSIERDDLQEIIDNALEDMAREAGGDFDAQKCNLAEFCRRTGLTRSKARTIKSNGFKAKPHGRLRLKAAPTGRRGHTGLVDHPPRRDVTSSRAVFERLVEQGYRGGLTTVKAYMADHRDLVPAKRKAVAPQGSRGQRFRTGPGESYQMDWGFVNVEDREAGETCRIACFAMCCHHCGTSYVEFFPNARQESLFVGMLHAFMYMGVPDEVLTDNMRSVVTRRDAAGHPVWNAEYEAFMACVGFRTRLCKPRHPFTKGQVERLVRHVKGGMLAGYDFTDLTRLNEDALLWCARQAARYRRAVDCVPADEHASACMAHARDVADPAAAEMYLCPGARSRSTGS